MERIGYKPKCFWAWNGDMEDAEIVRQIRDFKEKGIGGFFIHARGGLRIAYMGERWLNAVGVAIREAKNCGLEVWLYDEYGWPSGFAGGAVPARGDAYRMKYLKCADADEPTDETRVVARFGGKKVYYEVNPYYSDVLSPDAVDAFLQSTHEVYKRRFGEYFGSVIKGIFTDEPQYAQYVWNEWVEREYDGSGNTSLREDCLHLFEESEKSVEVRARYYTAICKLMRRHYTDRLAAWCEKNGLMLTGHFPYEDTVCGQVHSGGDCMYNYAAIQYPGIDFLGNRLISPLPLKQLSSVANQFDKPYTLSETFGCCGWNVSFGDYARIWGYQSALGVNTACLHLSAYGITGIRKRDYPAFFSYQEGWWSVFGYFAEWMKNIGEFVSRGKKNNDVLVISPLCDGYSHKSESLRSRSVSHEYRLLIENLLNEQIGFDLGDEFLLGTYARVEKDVLAVGAQRYRYVILPNADSIGAQTFALLDEYTKNGGKLLFCGRYPNRARNTPREEYESFLARFTNQPFGKIVQNRAALWGKLFTAERYARKVRVEDRLGNTVNGLMINVREDEEHLYTLFCNPSAADTKNGTAHFAACGRLARFDLKNGLETDIPCALSDCDTMSELTLAPGESATFVLYKGDVPRASGEKNETSCTLPVVKAHFSAANALNIDRAAYAVDGENYSEETDLTRLQQLVYDKAVHAAKKQTLRIRYTFWADYIPGDLKLYFERSPQVKYSLNGTDIAADPDDWWIDRGICGCAIADKAVKGRNAFVAEYTLEAISDAVCLEKVFETEKNKFRFPLEVESAYLTGSFDLKAENAAVDRGRYISVPEGKFVLTAPCGKDFTRSLTEQGMYFYRGNVIFESSLRYDGGKVVLRNERMRAPVAAVKVNGIDAGVLFSPYDELDVTALLHAGENKVETEIVGSNRNVLGPHHYYGGESNFVGVDTFNGTRGYEDYFSDPVPPQCTYTPDYHFVPFCVGRITAKTCK